MEFITQTDLACEAPKGKREKGEEQAVRERQVGPFLVSYLERELTPDSSGVSTAVGHYVTVEYKDLPLMGEDVLASLSLLLAREIRLMAERVSGKSIGADFGVFVVGLGNAEMTVDAVGPQTVAKLHATRHLCAHERDLYEHIGCASVSMLAPGVLGQTGVETAELVRGVVEHVRPDVVLAVDALAARSCERLASVIQLSDSGIAPGSGVGNHRGALSLESLGVPVLALGVPTVVDSATLVYDALREAGIGEVCESLQRILEKRRSFFVSPRDSDLTVDMLSTILARAIGEAFGSWL